MPNPTPILSVEAVEAVYAASIAALQGMTFTVAPGEIVALLGTNGAGKSTTLKAVSNLLPAQRGRVTAGTIRFDGRDVRKFTPAALVRQGLVQVLEGRHCFQTLTVEENLVTGGLGRSARQAELSLDLERVYDVFPRLRDKRKSVAGLTSGGEQQMTAIGRALMSRPRLLVLDEPSMGLAPLVAQHIFDRLADLNRSERLSILLAEQNATVALRYAHRAVMIASGRTILEGRAADLRRREDLKDLYLGRAVIDGLATSAAA